MAALPSGASADASVAMLGLQPQVGLRRSARIAKKVGRPPKDHSANQSQTRRKRQAQGQAGTDEALAKRHKDCADDGLAPDELEAMMVLMGLAANPVDFQGGNHAAAKPPKVNTYSAYLSSLCTSINQCVCLCEAVAG